MASRRRLTDLNERWGSWNRLRIGRIPGPFRRDLNLWHVIDQLPAIVLSKARSAREFQRPLFAQKVSIRRPRRGLRASPDRSASEAPFDGQATATTQVHRLRHDGGVLELRLVGTARHNALARSTIDEIDTIAADPPQSTRVIVITADGPDFCSGYDLREAADGDADALIANEMNFAMLKRCSVPVIAAIQGNVIGGGLELALAADIRVATPTTKFSIPAGRIGLVYSESGVRLLVSQLGESRTRAMLLGGLALSGKEATAAGIVAEVIASGRLQERALELAEAVASWSSVATSGNRQVLDTAVGRVFEDAAALRLGSFAPGGTLARTIARFSGDDKQAVRDSVLAVRYAPQWRSFVASASSRLRRFLTQARALCSFRLVL